MIASSRSTRTARPSALDTTFDVTTTTSPSASAKSSPASAASSTAARSSPAATSGTPSGAQTSSDPLIRVRGQLGREGERGAGHAGGRVDVGHQQRHGAAGDPGGLDGCHGVGVAGVHQPAVEQPAVTAPAVVQRDRGGGRLDADRGEHPVGHAAHRGAADDRREPDDRRGGS